MPSSQKIDTMVIGAGPAGYACAFRLGHLGRQVVLVESTYLGGVCLNEGCIPSKALITAAKFYEHIQKASEMGIEVTGLTLDFSKLQAWKQKVTSKLTGGVGQLAKGNKVKVVLGIATFLGAKQVEVKSEKGTDVYEPENIVIATGSLPVEIPGFAFDGENVLGSRHALNLTEVPKRLLVIGGGYIGLEIGTMLAKFGCQVTVVEMMGQILPGFDAELAQVVARKLKRNKIPFHVNAKAVSYQKTADGLEVTVSVDGKEQGIQVDKILVTVGRRPRTKGFGLEKTGVVIDPKGFIKVDDQRRTNVPHIFAVGDIAGEPMLAHKGYKEGEVAAEVIAGHPSAYDVRTIPSVVFTDPEIATVGLSEEQAKAAGHEVLTAKVPFAAIGKALANGETDGFTKVIADKKSKEVLGIQVVGYNASEIIGEGALAIEMGAFLEDIALTVHAHPTLPESIMEAAKLALGEAIHVLNA